MIKIKYNAYIDLKIFLSTLFNKRWLDKEKYFYYLFNLKKRKIRFKDLAVNVKNLLKKYDKVIENNEKYAVYLTHFGTFGSYDPPNIIYANIYREPEQIVETILHEIIHLKVEHVVLKKRLTHDEKEKFVDEIYNDIFKK